MFSVAPAPLASTFDCWPDSAPPWVVLQTIPGVVVDRVNVMVDPGRQTLTTSVSYDQLQRLPSSRAGAVSAVTNGIWK